VTAGVCATPPRRTGLREPRTYRGVLIHPDITRNSWGLRWWAFGPQGLLRADTLDGMKQLIRSALGVQ
jgi:hypothetical protein